jgi:hypothetical protein
MFLKNLKSQNFEFAYHQRSSNQDGNFPLENTFLNP